MKMNKTQLDYARQRLEEIYRNKAADLRQACIVEAKKEPPTLGELAQLIKTGKVKMRDDIYAENRLRGDTYIGSIFNIDPYLAHSQPKYDEKRHEARYTALRSEFRVAVDRLVLGDAKEALSMIEAFAAKEF
jgi:hypothetical protein